MLFRTRFSRRFIYFIKKRYLNDSEIIQRDILNFANTDYKSLCGFYCKRNKKVDLFFSKVWVLKYQGWVIIYFFYYSTVFNKFLKFTKTYGIFTFQYNSIFYNYYTNLLKLGFDSRTFKRSSKNSFIF